MIRFDSKTQLIISNNLCDSVKKILEEEKANKIGILIDENVSNQREIKKLDELSSKFTLFKKEVKSIEPTTDMVNNFTSFYKQKKVDFFVGIGGGSTIDLSKAVSTMIKNPGKVEEYHGTGKNLIGAVRKIMIPTTAGTGAEVTPGAVLVNEETKFKRALGGRCVSAEYAILNPVITTTMPDSVTASTGMDALGHAIESYTAKNANIITRMYSKEAFNLVFNNLDKVFDDKKNLKIREKILLGSSLAGYAIYNSNTGACHSMAYPLGIYNKVPHGVGVALILPKVIKHNIRNGCYLYTDLYDLVDNKKDKNSKKEKAEMFYEIFKEYKPLKHLKTSLKDFGIDQNNYEFLAEKGLDLTPALSNNPVDFEYKDALKILKDLTC